MFQVVFWACIVGSVALLFAATKAPASVDPEVPTQPGPEDRCPVCGMSVLPFPEWIAQIRFRDGSTVFFDGCKDLFRYLLSDAGRGPANGSKDGDVVAIYVTNYYDGEAMAARPAWFVVGSDVMGPMGPELVPHRCRDAAEDFVKDHGGRRILTFDQIDEGVLGTLE
jgi:nitrous oxide reductase accessory protein NosL